ncbi:MAG: hypothetical protein HC771_24305 [Synechococcales cyanobacterium CRU_2_2]|nr:hypothetical protein [Synechococcales cyanobacterium CRU_2_2]
MARPSEVILSEISQGDLSPRIVGQQILLWLGQPLKRARSGLDDHS